MKGRNEERKER